MSAIKIHDLPMSHGNDLQVLSKDSVDLMNISGGSSGISALANAMQAICAKFLAFKAAQS